MKTTDTRKVELLRDGAKTKLNIVTKTTMDSSVTGKSELAGSLVVDGNFAWGLTEAFGKKYVTKLKGDSYGEIFEYSGGQQLMKSLRTYHQLTLLPDETVDGKPAFVIQGQDKPVQPNSLTVKYYIGKETGSLIQSVSTSPANYKDQQIKVTMKILNLKINPEIPAAHFTFTPPRGAEFNDQTKQ